MFNQKMVCKFCEKEVELTEKELYYSMENYIKFGGENLPHKRTLYLSFACEFCGIRNHITENNRGKITNEIRLRVQRRCFPHGKPEYCEFEGFFFSLSNINIANSPHKRKLTIREKIFGLKDFVLFPGEYIKD